MSLPSGENIKVSIEERVALVTIDHQPVNALDKQTMQELDSLFDAIKTDEQVKVVIVTGEGSIAFIAGADIKEVSRLKTAEEAQDVSSLGNKVFLKIQRLGKPVIAAINGICLGGGLEFAMACHIRISGDRVRFGQPEISLGIIPGWGGTQRLARIIGKAKAIEWILTGDIVTAQEAGRLGLVNHVVPQAQVLKVAKDIARKITSKGTIAVQKALQAIESGLDGSLDEGLAKESEAFGVIAATEDAKEGVAAFLGKRQPQFKDR